MCSVRDQAKHFGRLQTSTNSVTPEIKKEVDQATLSPSTALDHPAGSTSKQE